MGTTETTYEVTFRTAALDPAGFRTVRVEAGSEHAARLYAAQKLWGENAFWYTSDAAPQRGQVMRGSHHNATSITGVITCVATEIE